MPEFDSIFSSYRQKNHPPQTGRSPVCPHYQIIEICAKFAGYEIDPNRFCGQRVEAVNIGGILGGFEGNVYWPEATCSKVHDKLVGLMAFAKEKIEIQKESDMEAVFADKSKDIEERSRIIGEYIEKKKRIAAQNALLVSWRNSVWEISCSGPEGETNKHFRKIQKPEDLSNKEVFSKVEAFLGALEKITGPAAELLDLRRVSKGADNCERAPKHTQSGIRF
ncbi:MAG: hypothetical protein UX13_C0037G0003 [Candidatus Woesebacteria bacterium GW2011_GWB1_45_5]|uniref:Uncharacterized protein n=1 Tax=Candidatus Woesebacteria bacterium GW2011_GWB1_45_5 TaxID=1618581 RepID=A0A0G1MMZ2_9BACT|nr:MAG: hypothetical protein UX13_C0037G0003 [Candidatus Woesebacteria bacterium GW2011_GWB1_45_5]